MDYDPPSARSLTGGDLVGTKAEYGRGSDAFLRYVEFIASHENYEGMPDLHNYKGDVQWEAPSNRKTGKFKDTHQKRRDWWREKAKQIGIVPDTPQWISRVAKAIHPTLEKPCKRCGRVLDIRYCYPSAILLSRLRTLGYEDEQFVLDPLEHITDLLSRMVDHFGDRAFDDLPNMLRTGSITPPTLPQKLEAWLKWVMDAYVPREPNTLSPGAMSNAPDRLDGFHSFNLCCRGDADKGRSKTNLQSYVTDRRVFEYWVEGDWVAANALMGALRSDEYLKAQSCANDHPGPITADHIGPISLGFTHRPEFRLLCSPCNSGKNNRLLCSDVRLLIEAEDRGEQVVTWYSEQLWHLRKRDVTNDETALRLAKQLRDNRHTVMLVLAQIAEKEHFAFLSTLLGLEYADSLVSFESIRVESHIARSEVLTRTERTTAYATEQKARRIRVAFAALSDYANKESRNALYVMNEDIAQKISQVFEALQNQPEEMHELDNELSEILSNTRSWSDDRARNLANKVPRPEQEPGSFRAAKTLLVEAMNMVADQLNSMWQDDRYVRSAFDNELPGS
jgi:Alw26I/Eco31I/Esp3I family type II restriction endonuclease